MKHQIVSLGHCSCGWVAPADLAQGVDPICGALTVGAAAELHVLASALFEPLLGGRK